MKITKGETTYCISEQSDKWIVKRASDGVTVKYEIPKEICATEKELRDYILKNEMF